MEDFEPVTNQRNPERMFEAVVIRDALLGVRRLLLAFEQDSRIQPGPVLFPNPIQFQFLFFRHAVEDVADGGGPGA